jgi:hypothetical protein
VLSGSSTGQALHLAVFALALLLGLWLCRRMYLMLDTKRPVAFLSLIEWPG